jgi:hypothetical protein
LPSEQWLVALTTERHGSTRGEAAVSHMDGDVICVVAAGLAETEDGRRTHIQRILLGVLAINNSSSKHGSPRKQAKTINYFIK